MNTGNWPFDDSPNTTAFTTTKVVYDGLPVLLVCHDIDGDWQFLCGTTAEPEDCVVASLGCAVEKDKTLLELWNLPLGWRAWRDAITSPWQWEKKEDDEDDI